jgi:hypothetical protein
MDNDKIEVVSFVINSGRLLTLGVKCEVNVKKWGRGSCFCCFFFTQSSRSKFISSFNKVTEPCTIFNLTFTCKISKQSSNSLSNTHTSQRAMCVSSTTLQKLKPLISFSCTCILRIADDPSVPIGWRKPNHLKISLKQIFLFFVLIRHRIWATMDITFSDIRNHFRIAIENVHI